MGNGSVITTHLLTGNPQGLRRVFMKNKTCEMYVIPRSLISDAKSNDDLNLNQPGIYILLEDLNISDVFKPQAYIGHSEDVGTRLDQHLLECSKDGKNDFFNIVLVFVSTDHAINKADVQYLEAKAIIAAKEANRYSITNTNNGTIPHLSPDQRDVIEEFRGFVWLLTSFLGCKIFIDPSKEVKKNKKQHETTYFLKWDGVTARAYFVDGEMILLKGSEIRRKTVKSAKPENRKSKLANLPVSVIDDNKLILNDNVTFTSPSTAAWIVSGTGLNGWHFWKDAEGRKLNDIFRQ